MNYPPEASGSAHEDKHLSKTGEAAPAAASGVIESAASATGAVDANDEPDPAQVRRKRIVKTGFFVVLVVLLGLGGGPGLKAWKKSRANRNMAIAEAAVARSDFAAADFALRVAASAGADDVRFHRCAANHAALRRLPGGLVHRAKVAELEPGRASALAWADDAIALGQWGMAQEALRAAPAGDFDSGVRLRLARIAAGSGLRLKAIPIYRSLLDQKTEAAEAGVELGILLSISSLSTETEEAVSLLEAARRNPKWQPLATRALLTSAIRSGRAPAAAPLAREILSDPAASLPDHLLAIQCLTQTSVLEADVALATLQNAVSGRPADVAKVAEFLVLSGRTLAALEYLQREGAAKAEAHPELGKALVTVLSNLGRWDELHALLSNMKWRDEEPTRILALSRVEIASGRLTVARGLTMRAIEMTAQSEFDLRSLFLQARAWKMAEALEQIGWAAVRRHPTSRWARAVLFEACVASADSAALAKYYELLADQNPADDLASAQAALLNLLLGRKKKEAGMLADEIYLRAPTLEVAQLAKVLSLRASGSPSDALKLLERSPGAAQTPVGIGVKALLLADLSKRAEARACAAAIDREIVPLALRIALDTELSDEK